MSTAADMDDLPLCAWCHGPINGSPARAMGEVFHYAICYGEVLHAIEQHIDYEHTVDFHWSHR